VTRPFRAAALVYVVGLSFHTLDHFRRGLDVLTPEVLWAGNVGIVIALLAIALALAGHRLAAPIAVAHGLSQALGVAAVHLLPSWGAFSDSLIGGSVDALTWIAVLAEIASALAFGLAGVLVLRAGRRGPAARPQTT
jgi:hypothetical protein